MIGWDPSPTCLPRWQSNLPQGQDEGASARVIAGYTNLTPREDVAAAEEGATGGDVADTAFNNTDLTSTTQIMAGSMEWTALTS